MRDLLRRLLVEEEGQGVTEYTLMLGLVVMGLYVAVDTLDIPSSVSTLWTNVNTEVTDAASPAGP